MSTVLFEQEKDTRAVSAGEDGVRQYLWEIRQFPRLTPEEERELAKRCAEGDEEAIKQMVSSNLRLVVSVAREYAGRDIPLLDLVQEGSIGLLAAAKRFDYTLDFRFSTYATKWIRHCINRYILNCEGMIRVPRHTAEQVRKLLASRSALVQELGRDPTIEELAQHSGMQKEKIAQLQQLPEVCSLDAPTGETEDSKLQLLLEDVQAPQPQKELVRRELKNTLDSLMDSLPQRQQLTLRLRFGMEDGVCHTLEEIGKMLGISKERVRQIERQAMDKLQRLGTGLGLEDFLE